VSDNRLERALGLGPWRRASPYGILSAGDPVDWQPSPNTNSWVPEGGLAGFCLGAFLRSGRPRGPGKAFKNVGVFAPHLLEGFPRPPGPARPQKCTLKIRPDCLRVPRIRGSLDPSRSFSQNLVLGVQTDSSLRETHRLRWGASALTSIDGVPGRKRPFGPPR
jgi:hypothetical protein